MFQSASPSFLILLLALSCTNYDASRAPLTPQQTEITLLRADSLLKRGKVDSAKSLYSEVRDDQKRNVRALIGLGKVALADRDWHAALGMAKQAMKIDTGNIPSHYIAAIANRETGTGLMMRNTDWKSSRGYFEWILKRDSSFEDVLYQYALLERYDGFRDHALELVRAQIARKPELVGPQIGLYKLYRYYMAVLDPSEFVGWLGNQPGKLPQYFVGESLRRRGNLVAAESLFAELLHYPEEVSPQALRLSLARLRFQEGNRLAAESEYWKAINDLRAGLGSAILFEDLKYVLSDPELEYYNALDSISQRRDFFRSFWNFRNPSLALKVNVRLQEHIRRYTFAEQYYEFYGFRNRFNNPDFLGELRFPKAFALNQELNDMGLIYLRQGQPDDILRATPEQSDEAAKLFDKNDKWERMTRTPTKGTPGKQGINMDDGDDNGDVERAAEGLTPQSLRQDPCESWLYDATPESPKMIFYFQKHNSAGNNWRLSPNPSYDPMIAELQMWDVRFERLYAGKDIDRMHAEEQVKTESKALVDYALSTEKHTWEKKTETFHFPHQIDVFRAPGGQSLIDVSYAIPLAALAHSLPDTVRSIPVEVGFSLIDAKSHQAATQLDTLKVDLSRTRTGMILDLIRYTVPPDSYAVSMHIRPLGTDKIGTWRQTFRVRDFAQSDFMISSVQFLKPSTETGALAIDGVKVVQSPFRTQVRTEPFFVYFQIYNLVPDAEGNRSYRTECILLSKNEQDIGKGISVYKSEGTVKEEIATVFCQIDLHSIDRGQYTLIVRATDRKRVQTLMAERNLDILTP